LVLYKQAYPRSTVASNLLGLVYLRMGRTEEALREFQRAIDLAVVPVAPDLANASRTLMIMGRFEKAKKILDEWRQKGSLSPDQIAQRYRIAFFENDAATMERLAREIPADDTLWFGL